MANFDNIIQEINTNLPDNTTQAITAAKLRTTMIDLTNQIDTVQDNFESNVNGSIDEISNNVSLKQDANVTIYSYTPITYSSTYSGWIGVNGLQSGSNLYVRIFPVTQGNTYKIKGGFASGQSSYMYAYFNGDTFLQSYDSAVGQTGTTKEYEITVPTEGTITHIAIQGGSSNQAACSLKEVSETINITNQVISDRDNVAELEVKLQGITTEETKVTQQPVTGSYIKGSDGSIVSSSGTAYLEIALGVTKRVRFLGGWYTSTSYTSGYAFGHYSDQSTWVTDKSSVFDTNASTLGTKEYNIAVPEGATHFRTTAATSSVPALAQNFYCYLQTGERVVDLIEELEGELNENVEYQQTWVSNKALNSPVVGQAPIFVSNSSYKYCYIENLKSGDVVNAHFRAGTTYMYGAKLKNGVIVETINQAGTTTDRTYVVDNTFDSIILNDYIEYVSSPTAKLITTKSTITIIKNDITDLQDQIDEISQNVFEEVNILCFGNSFTQDTVGYLPWILREAEPNVKFNVYFTYMGGMPISECLAYIGGDGYSTIARNSNGDISLKYENHGGWDRIYSWNSQTETWTTPSSGSTNYHKSYTLYKCPWNANSWTSQSEPDIETVLNILGEGHKWDLITIQQGGSFNYLSWAWHFKPYIYELYARLKNRLNYEFKIGYIMTHSSYSNNPETLLTRYSNGILTNTTNIIENTPTEVVLPYATAIQNARTTYLTRFGSNVYDGAKLKNGFVTEIITRGSSNINITCDGTFDAIILNNESGSVSSPSAILNGTTQTWTSGTAYNLYVGCRPISRSDSTYKSLWLTGLVNGDVITSTSNTADNGVALLTDSAHLNDGIGCLTATYANAMSILNMIGSKKTILGSQIWPNSTWLRQHNVPATSAVYGLTKYNIWLAQQCAIMATKYPLQLTNMVEKGMCKEIEVYINNNDVISSNPIMSADLNGSWSTILSVPEGSTITDVKVYMNAEDITSTAYTYATQTVSISNVTAKVTIEVTVE